MAGTRILCNGACVAGVLFGSVLSGPLIAFVVIFSNFYAISVIIFNRNYYDPARSVSGAHGSRTAQAGAGVNPDQRSPELLEVFAATVVHKEMTEPIEKIEVMIPKNARLVLTMPAQGSKNF
ncbi:hypothetical protein BRY73_00800 [Ochrobactrum sp. P6BS-III]|uniref:hypothetical protein n=1 Tax=unclassified Ochrobactrum TaxID=239106 RepID=UPI000993C40C|nr:hypothetical protein [Ochrobactrum sp. P6BSIII]OOL20508.1 hypothetical protein BRY73_00800 [Ochrobactrum sp. P6BS-III]